MSLQSWVKTGRLALAGLFFIRPILSGIGRQPPLSYIRLRDGCASRTFVSRKIGPWIHRSFIRKIPGYTVMKTIVDGFSGAEINSRIQPALVASHDGAQLLAYLVEDHGNGKVTVFLPKSPSAATGTVAIFPKELVTPLDIKLGEAVTALNQWGVGTRALLEKGLNTEKQI